MDSESTGEVDLEKVPHMLRVAADVTPGEYRQAKTQRLLLWLAAAFAILVGFGVAFYLGGGLIDALVISTAAGCCAHLLVSRFLPNAKKLSTMRLQKYPELQVFLAGRTISGSGGSES